MKRPSYKTKWQRTKRSFLVTVTILLLFVAMLIISGWLERRNQILSPLPDSNIQGFGAITNTVMAYEPVVKPIEDLCESDLCRFDYWVGKYTDKYFDLNSQRSEVRMIMQCLLHRESGHQPHDANGPHGDGGKAGGILQYHAPTWIGYRKIMMDEGLVSEIGSRYNPEQAIETTVWAISTGRAKAWGPILRDSNGLDYASCQTPSWY